MLFRSSTGMPVADAHDDFLRTRRAQVAARLEVIPLKAIVGTFEPTIMFDAAFRPASDLVSGATGAGRTLLGGVALTAGGVARSPREPRSS